MSPIVNFAFSYHPRISTMSDEEYQDLVNKIKGDQIKYYETLSELARTLTDNGGAEKMATLAFLTSIALFDHCGYDLDKIKEMINSTFELNERMKKQEDGKPN